MESLGYRYCNRTDTGKSGAKAVATINGNQRQYEMHVKKARPTVAGFDVTVPALPISCTVELLGSPSASEIEIPAASSVCYNPRGFRYLQSSQDP